MKTPRAIPADDSHCPALIYTSNINRYLSMVDIVVVSGKGDHPLISM